MYKLNNKYVYLSIILVGWQTLFNPLQGFAQENPKNLIFEGAGIRGIAYCGALQALEQQNLIEDVTSVGGTSAGAITALCVSLGYTSAEISELLYATNFKKFNDGRFLFPGGINRMNKHFGWYRGERFLKWTREIIKLKTGNPDITFEQLYKSGFKDLYITATVLNQQKLVVLSRLTYPNMRICDAVRISISIPYYFEAVFVDKDGQVVKRPKDKAKWDLMIDGGFTGNFPIRIFDSLSTAGKPAQFQINNHTLGFRIDSEEQINMDSTGDGLELVAIPVTNLREYTQAFYNIIIENLNRQTLSKQEWNRTVSISDGSIGPRIRKLSKEEVAVLIENGRRATLAYLEKRYAKNHLPKINH